MSLLNKMLKDIEQRDPPNEFNLEPTVVVKSTPDYRYWLTGLLVVLLAVALVVAAYVLIPNRQAQTSAQPVVQTQQSIKGESKTPVAESISELSSGSSSEPSSGSSSEPSYSKAVPAAPTQFTNVAQNVTQVEQLTEPARSAEPAQPKTMPKVMPAKKITPSKAVQPTQAQPSTAVKTVQPVSPQTSVAKTSAAANTAIKKAKPTSAAKQPVAIITARPLSPSQQAQNWFTQAQQSLQFSLTTQAIEQLERALQAQPTHQQARALLASIYYGQNSVELAASVLQQGLNIAPNTLYWRVLLGKIYIEQQQYQQVLQLLGEHHDQHANLDYWILKGTAASELQQYQLAKQSFTQLVQRQPNLAKWWLALANAQYGLHAYASAAAHYKQALEIGGLSAQSQQFALSQYQQLQGHYD